jgi:hypothetical protein
MTPTAIKAEVAGQKWAADYVLPTCSVAESQSRTATRLAASGST